MANGEFSEGPWGEIVAAAIAVMGTVAAGARWIFGIGRRVDQLEEDRNELRRDVDALQAVAHDTAVVLGTIATDIHWIKDKVSKL